jgi:hypothetical protein
MIDGFDHILKKVERKEGRRGGKRNGVKRLEGISVEGPWETFHTWALPQPNI